ncbi:MAG: hypothetical protein KH812_15905 [Proteus hauseri]|nr:hypothetical protein [Proteus hauseri]
MKTIYLDYQLYIDYFDDDSEDENRKQYKVPLDKIKNYQLVYSPAHCEEILVFELLKKNKEATLQRLKTLSSLTNDLSINIEGEFHKESSLECYRRCKLFSKSNIIAEEGQKIIAEQGVLARGRENKNKDLDPIEDILKLDYFVDEIKKSYIELYIKNYIFDLYIDRVIFHPICQNDIDRVNYDAVIFYELYNTLFKEYIDSLMLEPYLIYKKTKKYPLVFNTLLDVLHRTLIRANYKIDNVKKHRSTLHDISHVEYAYHADYFITRDEKLAFRTEAIYKYLGVNTRVIYAKDNSWINEFLE